MAQAAQGSSLPLGGIIALLLFASGMFVQHVPIESDRPGTGGPYARPAGAGQVIEARLWQDPFDAVRRSDLVAKDSDASAMPKAGEGVRGLEWFRQNVAARVDDATLVLPVMTFGGPYAEDIEERRRTRYAVLAALRAAGYEPANSRAIGSVRISEDKPRLPAPRAAVGNRCASLEPLAGLEVPFEEWREIGLSANEGSTNKTSGAKERWKTVLVIWVKEEWVSEDAAWRLGRLFSHFLFRKQWKDLTDEQIRFIGPTSWATANSLLRANPPPCDRNVAPQVSGAGGSNGSRENDADHSRNRIADKHLRFISPSLTDPTENLRALRISRNDSEIVDAIIAELALRNIHLTPQAPGTVCDHAALIVESDTHFGRSLEQQFVKRLGSCMPEDKLKSLRIFRYFRGLDGKTAHRSEAEKKKMFDASGKDIATAPQEQAQGDGQFDYLLRVATRLRDTSDRLHARGQNGIGTEEHGLKAVVVLGTDIHDKLAIFHALREKLPDAVFATNDLDAALIQRDQLAWTRNVVVASSWGFEAPRELRDGAPYFRDTYQTATYLSARLALARGVSEWNVIKPMIAGSHAPEEGKPETRAGAKVFEIGNHREVALDRSRGLKHQFIKAHGLAAGVILLAGCAVLITVSWCLRGAFTHRTKFRVLIAALVFAVIYVGLALCVSTWPGEEPFGLGTGVSAWPSEFIRLAAFFLALYALYVAHRSSREAELEVGTAYIADGSNASSPSNSKSVGSGLSAWFVAFPTVKSHRGKDFVDLGALWSRFTQWTATPSTARRLGALALGFTVLAISLLSIDPPVSPVRGPWSRFVDRATMGICIIATMFLLFYVFDRIVMTSLFLKHLYGDEHQPKPSNWSGHPGLSRFFGDVDWSCHHPATRAAYSYVDVRLSAHLTRHVTEMIAYPFAITLLLVFARARYFDAWQTPIGLLLVVALGLALATLGALGLRSAGERIRAQAIRELAAAEVYLEAQTDGAQGGNIARCPSLAVLRRLRETVSTLKEGAFAPFSEQPIIRALAMPFGGFGLMSLLDWATFMR